MIKIIVMAILVVAVVGIGGALWISAGRTNSSDAGREFFDTPADYDTSGGQQMQPRWND